MNVRLFLPLAMALLGAILPLAAQHHEGHTAPPAAKIEKPVIFLDKSPAIVRFQLGRLSNEQLLLVDREPSHPKFAPVYEAILLRPKMPAKLRAEAITALAILRKTDAPTEILAALGRLPPGENPGLNRDLAALLLAQDPQMLRKNAPALKTLTGGGPAAVRQAAFAALALLEPADALWKLAQESPAGTPALLEGLPLLPDAARRAAFLPQILAHLKTGTDAPASARALASIPRDALPAPELQPAADALLAAAKQIPEAERTQDDFLDLRSLAQTLSTRLPGEKGPALRRAFAALGVNVLRLRTLHEQMFFDKTRLVAEAGKPTLLILENTDAMQHNWVLTAVGAADEIGAAAEKMQPTPDSQGRIHVPASPKVLQATKMLNSGDIVRLRFNAPAEPGSYPYLCSYPGHAQRMRGTLLVVADLEKHLATAGPEQPEPVVTEWKLADFDPELAKPPTGRDLAGGKALFAANCASCHQLGPEGVPFGPNLAGVLAKYKGDRKALLEQILDPSKGIEDRYRNHSFELGDELSLSGLILAEDATSITVQTGPGATQKLKKTEIKSRRTSAVSLMPAGLLGILTKGQILDLLAHIETAGVAAGKTSSKP
jgi:putative heme-binding domain-containing protein